MSLKVNYLWFLPVLFLYTLPLHAVECDMTENTVIVKNNHIQKRTEDRIMVNNVLATQTYSGDKITVCNEQQSADLTLLANEPHSTAPARYFRNINGVPAYYLNDEYAYSITSEDNINFTAQGEKLSVSGRSGVTSLPGATVTVYATTDNPRPLSLSSAQIGSIKNNRNETVMKLMLSANITPVDNCIINNDNLYFNFNEIDKSDLPANTGPTRFTAKNTLSLYCTDSRVNKTVTMMLSSHGDYADSGKSVIASDNPGIGFILFYNNKQITHQAETELGSMTNHLEPQLVAQLYKLTRDVSPGPFKGAIEYTLKFN